MNHLGYRLLPVGYRGAQGTKSRQGRPKLAQRFNAGSPRGYASSPEGAAEP